MKLLPIEIAAEINEFLGFGNGLDTCLKKIVTD